MSKWINLALFSLLTTAHFSVQAESTQPEHKFFLGVGASGGSGTYEVKGKGIGGSTKEEIDVDTSAANIHLGFMLKNNNRFILSFESLSIEDGAGDEYEADGIRFDWQFVYGDQKVHPYFGLGFGLYSSKDLADIWKETLIITESKLNGFSFQLVGGVKFDITESIELDLNLQSRAIAWQDIDVYTGASKSGTIEQSISDFSVGFGIDFKF